MRARSRRPPVWLALLAVAGAAAAAGWVAVWAVDAVSPTVPVRAVVTVVEQTEVQTTDGTSSGYRVQARDEQGRALDLGNGEALSRAVSFAEPVVLAVSRVSGNVVAVRSADERVDLRVTAASIAGLVAGALVLASAVSWARSIWRVPHPAAVAAVCAAGLLAAGLVQLGGPVIAETRVLSDDTGMSIYSDPRYFPDRTAQTGQQVRAREFTVQVTGPLSEVPPAGAPAWLQDFHLVVVPVTVTYASDHTRGYLPVTLLGQGPGQAALVRAPACGGVTGAFDGDGPAEQLTTTGPMCFAVPAGFQPRYLLLDWPHRTPSPYWSPSAEPHPQVPLQIPARDWCGIQTMARKVNSPPPEAGMHFAIPSFGPAV